MMPGSVRFRGASEHGFLPGYDVVPEVQLADGSWMRLQCVCSATITIKPDAMVTATMVIELAALDLAGVAPIWKERRPWWRRAWKWVRMVRGHFTSTTV